MSGRWSSRAFSASPGAPKGDDGAEGFAFLSAEEA